MSSCFDKDKRQENRRGWGSREGEGKIDKRKTEQATPISFKNPEESASLRLHDVNVHLSEGSRQTCSRTDEQRQLCNSQRVSSGG